MTLSSILIQRQTLLRQVRLANLAFAYDTLTRFAERIARARLRGRVCVKQAAPDAEQYWATLEALDGSQSVIEEHFTDEDIIDLADVISYLSGQESLDLVFPLEELGERFLAPLRAELEQAGVALESGPGPVRETKSQ